MRLYAITDRKDLAAVRGEEPRPGEDPESSASRFAEVERLRHLVAEWIEGGVEFIQLREKDLNAYRLGSLAAEVLQGIEQRQARFLINLPASPAWLKVLAPLADGVHIPGRPKPGTAELVRQVFAGCGRDAIVSMACHSVEDARLACADGADLVLFAPVFEKRVGEKKVDDPAGDEASSVPGQGLEALHRVCEAAGELPVFALGGVTAANAAQCVAAGAAGIAGIRLFAGDEWRKLNAAPGSGPGSGEDARPIYS
jgi:thiamine-phosphate pyrophosphorylase